MSDALNPIARANRQAAEIAAREVYARSIHCPRHRASLEAWRAGERDWPWPDDAPEQADDAVRGLMQSYCRGFEL